MASEKRMLSSELVTVFGGSGFIGRNVVRILAKRGYRIRAAVRRPHLAGDLQPLGGVGQIHAVQANVRDRASVDRAIEGAHTVVNLVGILQEAGRQSFEAVHAEGARTVAVAALAGGARRFVQMSALGADPDSTSLYARTKAEGEAAARGIMTGAVALRPSVVFGPDDEFFNRFAALARLLPVVPLVGAATRFQPVFVGDVAEAVAGAVDGTAAGGRIYELGGPEIRTLREIVEYVLAVTGRRRLLLPLPFAVARAQAAVIELADRLSLGLMPDDFVITRDQVRLLERDNVVSEAAKRDGRTFEGLGLVPTGYDAIVPSYLWRFRKSGQFDQEPVIADQQRSLTIDH